MRWEVLLGAVLLGGAMSAGAEAAPPNVVMILSDDQAWSDFGFMGHPVIQTPHLDRLAAGGLTFTRGYVTCSLCRPSLASIITGLYPHQHKIANNDPPAEPAGQRAQRREEQIAWIDQVPTLPRMLAPEGYVSLQAGKWWEGDFRRGGFTQGITHGDPQRGGRHGDVGLTIGREGIGPIVEFLDHVSNQPFLLWYAPMLPHEPHNPPERLLSKYRDKTASLHVARYWAMCEWFDETCGQVLDALDARGLSDNTIVVFVVDNGWLQQPDQPGFAPRSKRSPNEGGIRTPVLVRWPARLAPRRDETTLVSSIDLAPTILAACGLKPTAEMAGLNLMDRDALARRTAVFGEIFAHDAVDVHNPAASLQYRWCIEGWTKLILPSAATLPTAQPELYDLKADPSEQQDLAAEAPGRMAKLHAQIEAWWPGR